MPYQHGVRVLEQATSIVAPILGTAGLQVVFGTAPINLADDPYKVTNTPLIAYSWAEAVKQLGYSADYKNYTLCEAMYASFQLIGVAPVIFINVLDPKKHKKKNEAATVPVEEMEAVVPITGILKDTVTVKMKGADEESEDTPLGFETDYLLSFDDDGNLLVTLIAGGAGAAAKALVVESTSIDPTAVKPSDIIGASATGGAKGFEVLQQIYPKYGMTPAFCWPPAGAISRMWASSSLRNARKSTATSPANASSTLTAPPMDAPHTATSRWPKRRLDAFLPTPWPSGPALL